MNWDCPCYRDSFVPDVFICRVEVVEGFRLENEQYFPHPFIVGPDRDLTAFNLLFDLPLGNPFLKTVISGSTAFQLSTRLLLVLQ